MRTDCKPHHQRTKKTSILRMAVSSSALVDLKVWQDLQTKIEDDTKIRDVSILRRRPIGPEQFLSVASKYVTLRRT